MPSKSENLQDANHSKTHAGTPNSARQQQNLFDFVKSQLSQLDALEQSKTSNQIAHYCLLVAKQKEDSSPSNQTLSEQFLTKETYSPLVEQLATLVDGLFDNFTKNKNLANAIKIQADKLRPVYLLLLWQDPKILLQDSDFDKGLLNSIVATGLMWDPSNPKSAPILTQISNSVSHILSLAKELDEFKSQFSQAVIHFSQFSQAQNKRVQIFEKRLREAEEGQAKAQAAKNEAESLIASVLSVEAIPEFIQKMFSNAWQHVFFLHCLKAHATSSRQADSKDELNDNPSFMAAKALLVSLIPIETIEQTEKFLELQPWLLNELKSGLEKTSFSYSEVNAFLEELDSFHGELLFNARSALERAPKEEIIRLSPVASPFDTDPTDETENNSQNQQTTLDLSSVQHDALELFPWVDAIFQQLPKTNSINSSPQVARGRIAKDKLANQKIIANLKPGRWFIYQLKAQEPLRCKLSAYINASDKYILVNGSGDKICEYNSESLQQALQTKTLSLLPTKPLFERILKDLVDAIDIPTEEPTTKKVLQKTNKNETLKSEVHIDNISTTNSLINTEKAPENNKAQPQNINQADPPFDLEQLADLAVGSWVEIKVGFKMKRCRLAARIASTRKLIFTDRSGIKVKECFDSDLKKLYQKGELKLDKQHSQFDETLSSVIANMRELKSERP